VIEDQKRLELHNEKVGFIGFSFTAFYLYPERLWTLNFLFPGYTNYKLGFD